MGIDTPDHQREMRLLSAFIKIIVCIASLDGLVPPRIEDTIEIVADPQPLWKPEYSVGVGTIDQQHQRLFSLLQELTMDDPARSHAVLVQEVEDYINFHFAHEQHIMSKYRYPRQQGHLDQHQDFQRQFQLLQAGAKTDAKQLARIRLMVYAWFTRHILGDTMDRDLGAWLQARGLPAA